MNLVKTDFHKQGIDALNTGLGIGNAMQKTKQLGIDRERQAMQDQQQNKLFGQKSQLNQQAIQSGELDIQQKEKAKAIGQVLTALNIEKLEDRNNFFSEIEKTATSAEAKAILGQLKGQDNLGQLTALNLVLANATGGSQGEANKQKGEKGLVFNPNTGDYSIDPMYAENQKEINNLDLLHKKKIHKLEVEKELAKKRTTNLAAREKEDIDNGLLAAETMPILKRADKLLDIVETGKPRQALEWGKKWFGIQGANEAELDQLLGKQILKQLKPTFGSQFTAAEGNWLKDMEANFGKSTEGNRALIRQGMELIKQRTSIGLDAAKYAGDERTIQNINDWMQWEFSESPQANKKTTELTEDELVNKYLHNKAQ